MRKVETFEKVAKWVRELKREAFTSFQIEKEFEMSYSQVKPILGALEEMGEIKYLQSNKLYVKLDKKDE